MWSVERIEPVAVELDFSFSEQGLRKATAIDAAGVRLFNAIELVEFEPSATQIQICEGCGYPHCASGGWVTFRRLGMRVVWIPAWHRMERAHWESDDEYRPPAFLSARGAPVFTVSAWDQLRSLHGGLPPADALSTLDSREAARLVQMSAPGRVLGELPAKPQLQFRRPIAVAEGELAAESEAVDACLRELLVAAVQMELVPETVPLSPIEFLLDLPGTPSWVSFARAGGDVCLLVDGGPALVRQDGCTSRCT